MIPSSYNLVYIDLGAIKNNYNLLCDISQNGAKALAMVKADGYGHGMVEVARALVQAGCTIFGVAELREAIILREADIEGDIYVMLGCDEQHVEKIFEFDLTPVVFSLHTLGKLSAAAEKRNMSLGVHLKIDSGMGRLGFMPHEVEEILKQIDKTPHVHLAGIMSHFSQSDDVSSPQTLKSIELFTKLGHKARKDFKGIFHIANSGGLLNFPTSHGDMVRPGISLYGYYPDGGGCIHQKNGKTLIPAMSYSTRVIQVKILPIGSGISYGHTFITKRKTQIAVLPVGYEDGYPRCLSNRGEVLIKGKRAPILGRVCMNLTMVDITDIQGVEEGERVVLLGAQGEETITADEIAGWADTISYEILCMIGNNNERKYTSL